MPVLLSALSALMYGAADFCGGLGTKKASLVPVLVFSQLIGLALAVCGAFALAEPFPRAVDLGWGAIAGICGAGGLAALYLAIATTPVAIASPAAAVVGAAIPVALGVITGERPTMLHWLGIALALPALALLTAGKVESSDRGAVRRAALLGCVAGCGFGLFFFAISRTSHASGLWPLVAGRVSTLTLISGFALVTRRSLRPAAQGIPFIVLSGLLDMGANIAFLLASRQGPLTTAAVVTSLYPGPTVLLALVVFRERLGASRAAGLVLALAGVALLSG